MFSDIPLEAVLEAKKNNYYTLRERERERDRIRVLNFGKGGK
jgi:hypothetical protein